MAFEQEPTKVPQSIEDISIQLYDLVDGTKGATYSVQVRMSDSSLKVRTGDLVPHITTNQRNALIGFMDSLRVQANQQILGES